MPAEVSILKKKPTNEELTLLNELVKPGAVIDVLVPDTIEVKEWKFYTGTVCKAYGRADLQQRRLLPVIGKLLAIAHEHKEQIWPTFETWDDFLEAEVTTKFGIHRSTAYDAMKAATRLPHLSVEEMADLPRRNLAIALRVIPKGDEKKTAAKTVLAKAAELAEKDFKAFLVEKGYMEDGDVDGAHIKIPCSKKVMKLWDKFVEDPQIHAVCGSSKPGDILEKLMEECRIEWKSQASQAAQAEEPVTEEAPEEVPANA